MNSIKFKNNTFFNIQSILCNNEFKNDFLKDYKVNQNIFNELINSNLSKVDIIYLSSNKYLNTSQLNRLEEYEIDNSIINILKHDNVDLKIIDKYLKLNDKVYNITLAHSKVLTSTQYKYLCDLNDFDVFISLSSNDKVNIKILEDLYKLNNQVINQCLCLNISTPIEILIFLESQEEFKTILLKNINYITYKNKIL